MNTAEVFKVSSTSAPASLAGAIAKSVREGKRIELQAIGSGAVNQAVKAIAIARGYVTASGIELVCIPSFFDAVIDGQERTGIRLMVLDNEGPTRRPTP